MGNNYHTIHRWWRFALAQHGKYEPNAMWSDAGWYKRIVGNLWWFTKNTKAYGENQ